MRAWILCAAAVAGTVLPGVVVAQLPSLDRQSVEVFEVWKFNHTEFSFEAEGRDYMMVHANEGPTRAMYSFSKDGETVADGDFCCDGARLLQLPEDGYYTAKFSGTGTVLLALPDGLNDALAEGVVFNHTVGDHVAVVAGRGSKTDYLCVWSQEPMDFVLYGARFHVMESGTNVTEFNVTFDGSWDFVTFVADTTAGTWVAGRVSTFDCEREAEPEGGAEERSTPDPAIPSPHPLLVLIVVLVLLGPGRGLGLFGSRGPGE